MHQFVLEKQLKISKNQKTFEESTAGNLESYDKCYVIRISNILNRLTYIFQYTTVRVYKLPTIDYIIVLWKNLYFFRYMMSVTGVEEALWVSLILIVFTSLLQIPHSVYAERPIVLYFIDQGYDAAVVLTSSVLYALLN